MAGEVAWWRAPVPGAGSTVGAFTRLVGVVLVAFAQATFPVYIQKLDHTILSFHYFPFHHLPFGPLSRVGLEWIRTALTVSGTFCALGVCTCCSLVAAALMMLYIMQLDRTLYNNHYFLITELCALLATLDSRSLSWPRKGIDLPSPRWQLLSVQLLVLTPYTYGAIAKINPDWLLRAEPLRSWAPDMLQKADDAVGGALTSFLDASVPPTLDVIPPFAYLVAYAGLFFDLLVSPALLLGPPGRARALAMLASLLFHGCNKLWFGLGVFPWLMVVANLLFLPAGLPARCLLWLASRFGRKGAPLADNRTHGHHLGLMGTAALSLVGALHLLVPLRGLLLYEESDRWTDEGALYAWHMKLVDRNGWLALQVAHHSDGPASTCDQTPVDAATSWLIPETDTALQPDQAGALVHNPAMLLQYAAHVRRLFELHGRRNVSICALSCVSVNGRPAQPLYMFTDLLPHVEPYLDVSNEFKGWSGVDRFLHRWNPAAASALCDLSLPHGVTSRQDATQRQLESDATYRWLYRPLRSRSSLADWPWTGRSRVPLHKFVSSSDDSATSGAEASMEPADWMKRCSFLQATEAIWCPSDA
ncbi:hypothetical protein AB1Y20_004827 [Prymnesium parvum]|uniref:HTTM-like domain-containing protein n=1 Tax=Prymnesium parvum TaxID=97485 RepID=A0AB34IXJ0_PRYPA